MKNHREKSSDSALSKFIEWLILHKKTILLLSMTLIEVTHFLTQNQSF